MPKPSGTKLILTSLGALALVGLSATPASATSASDPLVGTITGAYYDASQGRDYRGAFRAAFDDQCVVVERKLTSGAWTSGYVNGSVNPWCQHTYSAYWTITNDTAVSNTVAIRIRVTSGSNAGRGENLCDTKSQCLAMR